jgi:protein-disulfide isomerase
MSVRRYAALLSLLALPAFILPTADAKTSGQVRLAKAKAEKKAETKGEEKAPAAPPPAPPPEPQAPRLPPPLAPSATVAVIDGKPYLLETIDALITDQLLELRQKEFEARDEALENLVQGELLGKEAASRQLTIEALLKAEVGDKIKPVTDEAIGAFYKENEGAMRGQSLESLKPQIKEYLEQQASAEAQTAYVTSLKTKYGVKNMLEPIRLEISADDDPFKGPANAPVTIVAFSDYQCPYCSRVEETTSQLVKQYGDKIRIVFRDFPLEFHPNAQKAAEAANCAGAQGKYWEMHDALFANQQALDRDSLEKYAKSLKLEMKPFKQCLDSDQFAEEVKRDARDGSLHGVRGTPTFFVNGVILPGALPLADFQEAIDRELERIH